MGEALITRRGGGGGGEVVFLGKTTGSSTSLLYTPDYNKYNYLISTYYENSSGNLEYALLYLVTGVDTAVKLDTGGVVNPNSTSSIRVVATASQVGISLGSYKNIYSSVVAVSK